MEGTVGILGGSGLYRMAGLEVEAEVAVDTPFGSPSDSYFVGQMADFLRELGSAEHGADTLSTIVFGVLYRILPHFEIFDIREKLLMDHFVPWSLLGKVSAQAVIYIVVILLVGYLFFNEREV